MKKIVFMLITMTILLFRTGPAEATVIYDWVTTSVGPSDDGFTLTASLDISDQEYFNRAFQFPLNDINIVTCCVTYNGSLHTMVMGNDGIWWGTRLGTLSQDRTRIQTLGHLQTITQQFCDGIMYWEMASLAFTEMSATHAVGGWDASMYEPGQVPEEWDQYGGWVLRAGTAPIPEPGTFILLSIGLGGILVWRRQVRVTRSNVTGGSTAMV